MKERTKQILRYVACGLGGLALGIGLLGGLSMCATSGNKQTEDVNTILTTERVKHNGKTTTANGGYEKYYFSVPCEVIETDEGWYTCSVYSIDYPTYTPTLLEKTTGAVSGGIANARNLITNLTAEKGPTEYNTLRFIRISGHTTVLEGHSYWVYMSFLVRDVWAPSSVAKAFIVPGTSFEYFSHVSQNGLSSVAGGNYILSNETCNKFGIYNNSTLPSRRDYYHLQDVESYYKEQGYTDGYSEGYEDGDQEGYDNGYQDGNEHGQAQGYETGYNDGLTDGLEYGQEFTTYQIMTQSNNGGTYWPSYGWDINNNAPAEMYGNFDSSTYQIANLLQYKTEDNDLHLIYLMLRIESADDNQYFSHAYIYQYNQTDSRLEDTVGNGLMYYQAAADRYDWDYAHIYWTSGGTRTIDYGKVTGIYNDSLRKGYIQLSGQITDQTVYDTGYQAGLLAGQQNSNMNNVFSLFTGAFDACASFFNLRIFGFLPLYWFFLAPLFIALITLLLRMVKH